MYVYIFHRILSAAVQTSKPMKQMLQNTLNEAEANVYKFTAPELGIVDECLIASELENNLYWSCSPALP